MSSLRLSVIIEWENVLLAELGRSKRMLAQLQQQIAALCRQREIAQPTKRDAFLSRFASPVEVIVLYNDEEIAGEAVRAILDELIEPDSHALEVRLEAASGLHYYELKNFGARQATGDYLLFLDSDVVPDDSWLMALLGALAHEKVQVVGGDAYIEPEDTMAKAFSLFWFFDPPVAERTDQDALYRRGHFFANNVVFERQVFEAYPFPPLEEGTTRGACVTLAKHLEAHGIPVYRNAHARVSHPAPNGWKHVFTRAMAQGRDHVFRKGEAFDPNEARQTYYSDLRMLQRGLRRRDVRERHAIGLAEAPAVFGIGMAYLTTRFLGQLLAHARPVYVRDRFHI